MDEVKRKIDSDRKGKDDIRSNAKSRFLTKEFSQPVMSFNEMVTRIKRYTIEKASREYKFFRFQQDREIENVINFKHSLLYKSLSFDADEFHESFERNRAPYFPDISGSLRALRSIPANTALDFPSNIRPPSRKIMRIDSGRKRHRPTTSLPNSSRSQKLQSAKMKQIRPMTSHVRSRSAITCLHRAPSRPLSSRPGSALSKTDLEEQVEPEEQEGPGLIIKCKSYRFLKDKFTNKETDIPTIDPKAHRLKQLKLMENKKAEVIDKKIKIFISETLPGERIQDEYMQF